MNSATEVLSQGDLVEMRSIQAPYCVSQITAHTTSPVRGRRLESLDLRPAHRQLLEAWVRAGTTPQRVVRRARIVLLAAEGMSARTIAQRLGVSPHTVARWWRRYQKKGPATLLVDAPGRGRKATVAQQARTRIRAWLAMPPVSGRRWTIRGLAQAAGISRASVHRSLRAEGLSIDEGSARTAKSETTAPRNVTPASSPRGTRVAGAADKLTGQWAKRAHRRNVAHEPFTHDK